jgi:hypothetical protein
MSLRTALDLRRLTNCPCRQKCKRLTDLQTNVPEIPVTQNNTNFNILNKNEIIITKTTYVYNE